MRFPVLLVVALSVPGALSAQFEGALPKTTTLAASTRAMALGDSYAMSSGHSDAVFYHPALLTGSSGFGGTMQRWNAPGSFTSFSAAFDLFGGSWALGGRSLQYGVPDGSTLVAPTGQDHLFVPGGDPVSERTVTLAYARDIVAGISAGLAVDLLDARINRAQHNVSLVDLSLAREVGPVSVGLTAHDIGEKPFVDYGARPSRIVLGAGAYGRQVGILDVGFATNLGLDAADELTYGAGVEVGYWPIQGRTFVARLGVQDTPEGSEASPVTMGLAFWADDLTVEWAFRPFSGADEGGTHSVGLRWR